MKRFLTIAAIVGATMFATAKADEASDRQIQDLLSQIEEVGPEAIIKGIELFTYLDLCYPHAEAQRQDVEERVTEAMKAVSTHIYYRPPDLTFQLMRMVMTTDCDRKIRSQKTEEADALLSETRALHEKLMEYDRPAAADLPAIDLRSPPLKPVPSAERPRRTPSVEDTESGYDDTPRKEMDRLLEGIRALSNSESE